MSFDIKNTTTPEPLPSEQPRAVLTFTDTPDGQLHVDVRWYPDLYDHVSMAHREAYKVVAFLDSSMTRLPDEKRVETTAETADLSDLAEFSELEKVMILGPPLEPDIREGGHRVRASEEKRVETTAEENFDT